MIENRFHIWHDYMFIKVGVRFCLGEPQHALHNEAYRDDPASALFSQKSDMEDKTGTF